MPQGIIIHEYTDSNTGHMDVTFVHSDGSTETFGGNTQGLNHGGVFEEDDRPTRLPAGSSEQHDTFIPLDDTQFNNALDEAHARVEETDDNGFGYGLFGQNCVDFIRDILESAGLDNDVSAYAPLASLVATYAEVTDFLVNNGAENILDAAGEVVAGLGSAGNDLVNGFEAAEADLANGDIASAIDDAFSGVADAIGDVFDSVMGAIGDFIDNTFGDPGGCGGGMEGDSSSLDPVVLDLTGEGIKLIPIAQSHVSIDMGDGEGARHVGWVAPGSAILAIDANHNGIVDGAQEFRLTDYAPGAKTDLAALSAFDSNHDGVFDAKDAHYADFLVWDDANSDGICEAGEAKGLADAGVVSIALGLNGQIAINGGNLVSNTSTFLSAGGSTHQLGDVAFVAAHADSTNHASAGGGHGFIDDFAIDARDHAGFALAAIHGDPLGSAESLMLPMQPVSDFVPSNDAVWSPLEVSMGGDSLIDHDHGGLLDTPDHLHLHWAEAA